MTTPDWEATTPYTGPPQSWAPPTGSPYGTAPYAPTPYGPAPYVQAPYAQAHYDAAPYGPAPYGAAPYGRAAYGSYGAAPYGAPPYGAPGWGWPVVPPRPARPGSVIAAAVLVFASALLVLVGTLYAMTFGALVSLAYGPGSGFSPWLAVLQLVLAGLLVLGGAQVLNRDRRWLLVACAGQLALSVYWGVLLTGIASSAFNDTALVLPVVYGLLAAVAAGLTFLPDARRWTARPARDSAAETAEDPVPATEAGS